MGHWLEICEMRTRLRFCVGSRENEGPATRSMVARCKCFSGQLWFPSPICKGSLLMDWLSGHLPITVRAGTTSLAQCGGRRLTREARLSEHHAQGKCQGPLMAGPGEWPLLSRLRVMWLCPSETRGRKRSSKCFSLKANIFIVQQDMTLAESVTSS